jgi:transcriptional regulator GlxA family with amidase domain
MRVDVLALDDVFDLGLSAVVDAFQTANELIVMAHVDVTPFDVRIIGVKRSVRTCQGFRVPIAPRRRRPADCVVVPAIGFKMAALLERALGRSEVRDAAEMLEDMSNSGTLMTAACIGTFILAESGIMNGHDATTTWWLANVFRQRYPGVRLDEANMIVDSGSVVTAGAALSHMDLALWLIRRVSPHLASLTAKYLIVDSRPSQSAYAITDHLVHEDPVVQRFEAWCRSNLANGFALDEASRAAGASKRTLARHLQRVVGKSPLMYFQALRVEKAVHLLKTSELSVDEVASRVGYVDGATLRALLRRQLGTGVKQIRGQAY